MVRRQATIRMLALGGILLPVLAWAQSYSPQGVTLEAKGFKTDKDGRIQSGKDPNAYDLQKAKDLSGIACLPPGASGKRDCLVINDEDVFAQLATLDGTELKGGRLVRLIDEARTSEIRGREPKGLSCSAGEGRFKDLDGEGVAYMKPYFYVVGSHGCSRHKNKAALSSLILARVHVDDEGKMVGDDSTAVETTYRLNDIFRNNPDTRPYYGQDLDKEPTGLNIEGIAAIGNKLYVGLRAPSIAKRALIIETEIDDLFANGHAKSNSQGKSLLIELGENVGIRDLAPLEDGRLLVLAGPTLDQKKIPFSLHVFAPGTQATQQLAKLDDVFEGEDRAKAEAVWPLGGIGQPILVLFDGLKNGGARIYERQ